MDGFQRFKPLAQLETNGVNPTFFNTCISNFVYYGKYIDPKTE